LCDYIWQVQALNRSGKPMGNNNGMSEPYTFGLAEEKTKGPDNVFPEDKKIFTLAEVKKPLTFKWRPISPTPPEPVTYRLRVWQLMQGQSIKNVINSAKPIFDIDGNGQVDALTDGLLKYMETGPCKPPYLCDFVWNVEASIRQAGAVPKVIGTSEPTSFNVKESNSPVTIKNVFPEDNKSFSFELFFDGYEANRAVTKPLTFTWTAVTPKPQEPVTYRLKVWQLMQGQSGSQAMKTNQPIVTKDIADITEVTVSNMYTGPCRPPYLCDFIWEVQAITRTGTTLGTSNPTVFSVKEAQMKGPDNTFPEDKKEINSDNAMKGVMFKWTPVTPKPQEPVTYRLKVWQLMQGQNGTIAMKMNQPIVSKDVDNLTEATLSSIYTGPCRPPYLCDYIWEVQAVTRNGITVGTSKPTEFKIKEAPITGPNNTEPADKKEFTAAEAGKGVTFKWTALTPKPPYPVTYRLRVWQLMQGQSSSLAMRLNQPIATKDVDNLTEATISSIYTGPCRPPYLCDYIWEVQALTKNGETVATSHPTEFSVKEEKFNGPDNLFPENKKTFTINEATKPITFRWTPVVPKPQEPVTYRLKVWQLMQGQNSSEAMRTNKPIVTKDVADITEASVAGIYTGPCRPPYLCDYIWNVEAITRQAGAAPKTIGTSEATSFAVSNCDVNLSLKLKSVECLKSENGFNIYRICVATTYISPVYQLTYFNMGSGFSAYHPSYTPTYTVSNVTPALQVQNTGPSTTVNYCVDVSVPVGQNIIKLGLQGDDKDPGPIVCQPGAELDIDLPPCKCNACDSVKIQVVQKDLKFDASGNIILNTTISASPKPVSSIKAELVYYEYKPESDDCMLCNKDSRTFGNFGTGNHTQEWNFTPPQNLSNGEPASMIITVPPTVNCCDAKIRWCIRYVVTFEDCTVCNKLVCYEIKKDGCANENQNPKTGIK
jgi:hypothetical protein